MFETLCETVRSELSVRLGGRNSWYVLVDPAISDPLANCEGRHQAVSLAVRSVDMPRHFRPYLLWLGEIGRDERIDLTIRIGVEEALRATPHNGSRRSICGWIASELPPAVIVGHLVRHTRIRVRNQARTLRIWDPRTLDLVQHLLAKQAGTLLALPGCDWWWLGRDAHVKKLQASRNPESEPVGEHLNDEHIGALRLAEPLHATLNVLQDTQTDPIDDQTLRTVIGALRRASTQWGMSNPLDQVSFALHSCLVHPNFDADAEVAAAMRRAAGAGHVPTQALSSFDEQAWTAVRARLTGAKPNAGTKGNGELHHG